ncbi:YbaB/EbfC family nucleoid-associated protein [Nocardia sp. CA-290969]|uniref:YbaB/EbfC family nucleoid-associated protein n=1 Tax=Nocardia sp. CA-290969 TaxID=3239986 RepID=UPI003D918F15
MEPIFGPVRQNIYRPKCGRGVPEVNEHDEKQMRNDLLRVELSGLLDSFAESRDQLAEVQSRLTSTTVTAWSADGLVRVDSNAAGIPVDLHIDPGAFKRAAPDKLARSVLEAMQAAAQQAGEATQQAMAPFQAMAAEVPDLPDLIPGAPSVRELFAGLSAPPTVESPATRPLPAEADEDEYYLNRSYLNRDT